MHLTHSEIVKSEGQSPRRIRVGLGTATSAAVCQPALSSTMPSCLARWLVRVQQGRGSSRRYRAGSSPRRNRCRVLGRRPRTSKPSDGRYRASRGWYGRAATRHSRSAPSVRPAPPSWLQISNVIPDPSPGRRSTSSALPPCTLWVSPPTRISTGSPSEIATRTLSPAIRT